MRGFNPQRKRWLPSFSSHPLGGDYREVKQAVKVFFASLLMRRPDRQRRPGAGGWLHSSDACDAGPLGHGRQRHNGQKAMVRKQGGAMRYIGKFAGLAAALVLLFSGAARSQSLINGAGSTFGYPIYSKWFDDYVKIDPAVRVNYQSSGSGDGIMMLRNRAVDFGASDAPMND